MNLLDLVFIIIGGFAFLLYIAAAIFACSQALDYLYKRMSRKP